MDDVAPSRSGVIRACLAACLVMALAAGEEGRLPAAHIEPARFKLAMIHPRPESETAPTAYHRVAHPGLRWECPVRAAFGSYPYHYRLTAAPPGMTIGAWLERQPDGTLRETPAYGTLAWPAPVAGTHRIAVTITDQQGASVECSWTLTVAERSHYFAGPEASGAGDGSTPANRAAFSGVYGASHDAVSPAHGKVLVLAGGAYTLAQPFRLDARCKPIAVVAMPGETPEITAAGPDARFAFRSDDGFIAGLHLRGFGPKGCIFTYEAVHRLTVWRNAFSGLFGDPKISDNESVWYCSRLDNGKRRYLLMAENRYHDCRDVAIFDFYTVGPLLSERDVFTTTQAVLSEPLWFPKSMCDYDIRRHVCDVPASVAPGSGVMAGYNANMGEQPLSSGEVRWNFVRTAAGDGAVVKWNNSSTSISTECHDYRNTYIGAKVMALDHTKRARVAFAGNVIENVDGGISPRSAAACTSTADECHGTSGVVDAQGRLSGELRSRFLGRRGWEIAAP